MESEQQVEVPSLYEFSFHESDYFGATSNSRRATENLILNNENLIDNSKGFVTFKNEHYAKFDWGHFSEFFFYHFVFFFILGPLFPLIFLPITGISLMKNMGFLRLDIVFFSQFFLWFVFFSVVLVMIINPEWNQKQSVVTMIDLYTVVTLTLLRIANVASKYATFTPEKIAYLRHNVAKPQELHWDLTLGPWTSQSDEKILEEIEFAVKRNEVDLNLLMVEFLRPPDGETLERLNRKTHSFRKRNTSYCVKDQETGEGAKSVNDTEIKPEEPSNVNTVFGVAIIHDLIERYRENTCFKTIIVISLGISLVRAAIPWVIYRKFESLCCWETWAICIGLSIQTVYLYGMVTIFFALSDLDNKRKIFIQTQLGYMVAPKKYGGVEADKKIFPTTNFLSPKHLRGWNLLRKIGRDYGFSYSLREGNNMGWAAAIYIFFSVILALDFFGIVSLAALVNYDDKLYSTLKTMITFDVIFFFLLLSKELVLGIKLNRFYRTHKNTFEELQIFLSDIARKIDWYFVKNLKPKNYLYKFAVEYFKNPSKENNDEAVSERIEDLLSTMREIAHDIEFEEGHRPFTVLGFEPSSRLLSTIAIGVCSLTFALVQYYLHDERE